MRASREFFIGPFCAHAENCCNVSALPACNPPVAASASTKTGNIERALQGIFDVF
jgi:hypothetical protein